MNQLELDFGSEPNKKRMDKIRCFLNIRRNFITSMLDSIAGVQPITAPANLIFAIKSVKSYIPPIEEFELTEPYSEAEEQHGCWGVFIERNSWQRAGTNIEYVPCRH